MENKKKVSAEQMHILYVRTLGTEISNKEGKYIPSADKFSYDFRVQCGCDLDGEMVGVKVTTKVSGFDEEDKSNGTYGEFVEEIIFKVDQLKEYMSPEDKGMIMDQQLALSLVAIAFSTIRGIIFTRTQGTMLSGALLPIINPAKLLESTFFSLEDDVQ